MSVISTRIRKYVNDFSVSDHYGRWGALNPEQRKEIRELCDVCDMFEETADKYAKEVMMLKLEVDRLEQKNSELYGEAVTDVLTKMVGNEHIVEIKAEAIKEFADRFLQVAKEKTINYVVDFSIRERKIGWYEISVESFNNLVQEMVGGNDEIENTDT